MERFRAWLEAFGGALERGDADAAAALFVLEATWRPGPFEAPLRGRRAIGEYLARLVAERPSLVIRGRALGIGTTYGVAQWVAAWKATPGDPATPSPQGASADVSRSSDGILLVAFDPFGRCTSLREWSVVGEPGDLGAVDG